MSDTSSIIILIVAAVTYLIWGGGLIRNMRKIKQQLSLLAKSTSKNQLITVVDVYDNIKYVIFYWACLVASMTFLLLSLQVFNS